MSSLIQVRTDTFTDSGTDQLYELMSEAFEGPTERFKWTDTASEIAGYDGGRKWVYIKNGSAAAFAKGHVIMQSTGVGDVRGEPEKAALSALAIRVVGVAQAAIAAGEYGWVVREGDCEVLASAAGFTANTALVTDNAGGVIGTAEDSAGTAADIVREFGVAREAAAAGVTGRAYVSCRG